VLQRALFASDGHAQSNIEDLPASCLRAMQLRILALILSCIPLLSSALAFNPLGALFPREVAAPPDMNNMGKRIVALHDSKAVFDFCGGMMFQLVLSDKLRQEMLSKDPVVYDASMARMMSIPNYRQSSDADDVNVFYGREVRKVPNATGGMGFVLQLVSSKEDPEGWTTQEVAEYNGWAHDSGRKWRKSADHALEGNEAYSGRFGSNAFGLHHRFYWHLDARNNLWLSAEDGCEGFVRKF